MERDLMTRTDRFGVEVRERVMWDIREGVVGADTFIPKHVTFITWKNMSFAGGIDISLYKVSVLHKSRGYKKKHVRCGAEWGGKWVVEHQSTIERDFDWAVWLSAKEQPLNY